MKPLAEMTPAEVRAYMASSGDFGIYGSINHPNRYAVKIEGRRGRRKCHCGCGKMSTHSGRANGVALMSGCELTVARWVKDPVSYLKARHAKK